MFFPHVSTDDTDIDDNRNATTSNQSKSSDNAKGINVLMDECNIRWQILYPVKVSDVFYLVKVKLSSTLVFANKSKFGGKTLRNCLLWVLVWLIWCMYW